MILWNVDGKTVGDRIIALKSIVEETFNVSAYAPQVGVEKHHKIKF